MSDAGDTAFPGLPFDWYILEKWDSSVPIEESPQRRQKHIELGISYAALGHEGRRPYILKALEWQYGDRDTNSLPRSLTEVPIDLLASTARESGYDPYNPFFIRTDYGPGTDARFAELVKAHKDTDFISVAIENDRNRYELTKYDERAIFAFFPFLLESSDPEYNDDDLPFDSTEIQTRLFGGPEDRELGIDQEDLDSRHQGYFFVADSEAMRTGFVRWVLPDQYGKALFSERVQPWSLRDLPHKRVDNSLAELRQQVSKGWFGSDPRRSGHVVGPWTPPTTLVTR